MLILLNRLSIKSRYSYPLHTISLIFTRRKSTSTRCLHVNKPYPLYTMNSSSKGHCTRGQVAKSAVPKKINKTKRITTCSTVGHNCVYKQSHPNTKAQRIDSLFANLAATKRVVEKKKKSIRQKGKTPIFFITLSSRVQWNV